MQPSLTIAEYQPLVASPDRTVLSVYSLRDLGCLVVKPHYDIAPVPVDSRLSIPIANVAQDSGGDRLGPVTHACKHCRIGCPECPASTILSGLPK